MEAVADCRIPVQLQEITFFTVDNEATQGEIEIELQFPDGLGIVFPRNKFFHDYRMREAFKIFCIVADQSMVHIETDIFDAFEIKSAINKDFILRHDALRE